MIGRSLRFDPAAFEALKAALDPLPSREELEAKRLKRRQERELQYEKWDAVNRAKAQANQAAREEAERARPAPPEARPADPAPTQAASDPAESARRVAVPAAGQPCLHLYRPPLESNPIRDTVEKMRRGWR